MRTARLLFLYLFFSISIACSSNPRPQTTPQSPEEAKPPNPITLRVFPPFSVAMLDGATVKVTFRIERHPDNRRYYIVWSDKVSELGRSGKALNGENEQAVFNPIFLARLYEGQYEVRLVLTRIENGEEKQYIAIERFQVY